MLIALRYVLFVLGIVAWMLAVASIPGPRDQPPARRSSRWVAAYGAIAVACFVGIILSAL